MKIPPAQSCAPSPHRGQQDIPQLFGVIGGQPEGGGEDARLVATAGVRRTQAIIAELADIHDRPIRVRQSHVPR